MIDNKNELIKRLNKIGVSLSSEKNVNNLLNIILEESMNITSADAGSIYVKEEDEDGKETLRFSITKNNSRSFEWSEFSLDINKESIAGYVALTKDIVNLEIMDNAFKLYGINYNSSFDDKINYKTVNMLVIPMLNYEKEVVGVVQLINKKKNKFSILLEPHEIPDQIKNFEEEEIDIIKSLSAQAGILIERTRLYLGIEELLSSFIGAMVTTLDARDKTTSGHSRRLAGYALHFVQIINKIKYGKYKYVNFSDEEIKEFYYAALLHDIGKIGVDEKIPQKEKKLDKSKMEALKWKFRFLKEKLVNNEEYKDISTKLDDYYKFIESINGSGYLNDESKKTLDYLFGLKVNIDGEDFHLLHVEEYEHLSIQKGNLTKSEREKINYHVVDSFNILKDIKWTKKLKNVPDIAASHHEKIDGSGYPFGLKGEEISIQARILAILDIFEALTARDRPYKPPMSVEKAIKILEIEVNANHLDKDLFEIFMKEGIFELYKEELDKIIKI